MRAAQAICSRCAAPVTPTDRFCESCGVSLAIVGRVAIPVPGKTPPRPCADCGNESYVDDYCAVCGNLRSEPARDEANLDGIVLITDRGLEHPRNEDSAAAGRARPVGELPWAVAVAVCDGVSTSTGAYAASAAASAAGVDGMLGAMASGRTGRAAALAGLRDAARAAAAADGADPSISPSCTYTGAVVVPARDGSVQISVGSVGDSRAYWLPESPLPAELLTVDDSVAQELMSAGANQESAAVQAGAHVLTRWLGAEADSAPWADSSVRSVIATGPGFLVLCSDGLWNYLPDPEDIARFCTGTAMTAAHCLVDHALSAGGHDNVTVAIIPIGGRHEFS